VLDEARQQLEASKDGVWGPFYAILYGVGSVMDLCGDLREGLLVKYYPKTFFFYVLFP
jgi:hypothetical protein